MKKEMLALHFLGKGKTEVRKIPIPELKAGEVLVKVYASAICGSEKPDYFNEKESDVLSGHEVVGIVEQAVCSKIINKGDKVAIYALYGCGKCYYCQKGDYQFCTAIEGVSNSGHAQFTVCRDTNCLKIEEGISYDDAVMLYGDALGVAYRAVKSSAVKSGTTAYISGAGPIGLGIIVYLKHLGVRVIVGEPVEYRRDIAVNLAGADMALDPLEEDAMEILANKTGGIGPEFVFECSGNAKAELSAFRIVRCGGTICFAGENYKGITIVPSEHIIHREVHLTGAFYYSPEDINDIIREYRNGLDISKIVTHKFPLSEADTAFELFMEGRTGKVIIHPWDKKEK